VRVGVGEPGEQLLTGEQPVDEFVSEPSWVLFRPEMRGWNYVK
jgi:hypothetical protein